MEYRDEHGAFEIETRWKEQLFYWESNDGVDFQAGWGVAPGVIDLDSEARWQQDAPAWAVGRHALVLARLRERSGHAVGVLADDDAHRWMEFITR
jgi:hypothetical protein